ncbi:MAG: ATP-dependent DNA helicase PcrA, partial [Clostridia bacterium]|nr:ATP-dependent DNA helicase PcrA [Clostridia bacterium]
EVKDMLAYLCGLRNPADDLRLIRIINSPPRGIGARTLEGAQAIARVEGRSLWEIVKNARVYPELMKSAVKLSQFADLMETLRALMGTMPLPYLYEELLYRTGYAALLEAKNTVEDRTRLENVRELQTSIADYVENTPEPSLAGFLDTVSLFTDLDNHDAGEDCVVMMTMHAAKGLEFPVVFTVGLEEGIFPGIRAIGEPDEMEEERRLCYVAMTRAREQLYMTCAGQRMLFGRTSANSPSRFLKEVPPDHVELELRGTRTPVLTRQYTPRPLPQKQTAAELPSLKQGETVTHSAFGTGMVLSVAPMGGDALIEIAFDSVGTKRLMLKTAAQHLTKN